MYSMNGKKKSVPEVASAIWSESAIGGVRYRRFHCITLRVQGFNVSSRDKGATEYPLDNSRAVLARLPHNALHSVSIITSRDAQREARYSDRARPSVCLFVCLISKRVSGSSYTVENASNAALIPTSPEMKPEVAAVDSATVAVLSQSSFIEAIFPHEAGSRGIDRQ